MKISKEKIIVIFYILYFTWLLSITYLTRDVTFLNYYSLLVTGFYFIFLREKNDFYVFVGACLFSLLITFNLFLGLSFPADLIDLSVIPLWLPLAWGMTFVSLKKFAYMMLFR